MKNDKKLFDIFGPNPSQESIDLIDIACKKVCEYFEYVNSFVPTIECPYPLSDNEYFKKKEKDA